MTPVTRGLYLMLIATLALATMHGIVRYLSQDLHPFVIVFFRNVFGLLAILPLLASHGLKTLRTPQHKLHVLRAAMGICAMLSWFYALSRVPITNATALSFSAAIFASLCAWLFLGEIIRIRRWMAIACGLIGVLVVLRPGLEGFNAYSLLVVASTISWGVSITIVKKLSETDSAVCIVAWMAISLTVLSIVPAMIFWQQPDWQQLAWLALVGILATGGHLAMTHALKLADTALVMSVDFFRLIWTTLIGTLFFAELLDLWTFVGAAIIFASAWYIIFRESKIGLRG